MAVSSRAAEMAPMASFRSEIRPILQNYCFDCHADGVNKGNVALDAFISDEAAVTNRVLWEKALRNLRAGLMPPANKPHPTEAERSAVTQWIKSAVFDCDPNNPDPGRVTLRRLNRAEYRNTIHDLLGVDINTDEAFPPDDTGYGFDTVGDVLTMSPMLLEKYLTVAQKVVEQAVPLQPKVVAEQKIEGWEFRGGEANGGSLSYYKAAAVSNTFTARFPGKYHLGVDLMINEKFVDGVSDYNKCRLRFKADGEELLAREYSWEGGKPYHYEFDRDWTSGSHELAFDLQSLTPGEAPTRTLSIQITSVNVMGPMARQYWVAAKHYDRFFPKPIPPDAPGRRRYAQEILSRFARKAFRRNVDEKSSSRLAGLAEEIYQQPGKTFEDGVAEAMIAVLASPRFLFLEESAQSGPAKGPYPSLDEFSLASRLSYFLWSSMPDEELLRLAGEGTLRNNLSSEVKRMLDDKRSRNFVRDFTGQWLRARDVEHIPIEPRAVLSSIPN